MNHRSKWVTLSKTDPLFSKYLSNQIGPGKKAIPVRTSRALSGDERVTFRIDEPVSSRLGLAYLLSLFRIRDWIYFLVPVAWVVFYSESQGLFWDPWLTILCLFAILFLNLAAFLLNDSVDFEMGVDRISSKKAVALRQGRMTLSAVKKVSWSFLFLGALLGLPSVWVFPQVLLWVAPPAFVALWFWLRPNYQFKKKLSAELIVSLLYGLGLMGGLSLGITGSFSMALLGMGILFSLLFYLILNTRNFEYLMAEYLSSDVNFVHRLGFDRARYYLVIFWFIAGVSYLLWQWIFGSSFWVFIGALHFCFLGLLIALKSQKVISPLGSAKREFCLLIRSSVISVYFLLLAQIFLMGM